MSRRSDRGSASAELVIVAPILVVMAAVALLLGRLALLRSQVAEAARAAAEAAAVWPTPAEADAAGQLTGAYSLVHDGVHCTSSQVSVDTASLVAGGEVAAQVTCSVRIAAGFGLPGSFTLEASAVAPIETYREVG